MYKTDCIANIEEDFQETLAKCQEVTLETIKNETMYYKVMGKIMKFIAPLM
jgi:cardiolipin synthase